MRGPQRAYMFLGMHTHTYTYMHIHTRTYTHPYICIHPQMSETIAKHDGLYNTQILIDGTGSTHDEYAMFVNIHVK